MRRLLILTICIFMAFGLVGCGCGGGDDATLTDDKRVAITADGNDVYLDEAKYYAYSSQATYEVYYITNKKDIDWNEKVDGTSWQGTVKVQTLDDICRREFFYNKRDEYNVKLDSDEKKEVGKQVQNYYSQSSKKLKDKIGIKKSRLKEIFTKDAISRKVEDIMNAEEKGASGKAYKNWYSDSKIEYAKCWSDINFNDHIFELKDANY